MQRTLRTVDIQRLHNLMRLEPHDYFHRYMSLAPWALILLLPLNPKPFWGFLLKSLSTPKEAKTPLSQSRSQSQGLGFRADEKESDHTALQGFASPINRQALRLLDADRGTIFGGVPIIRIIVFGRLYWRPPYFGKL